MMNLKEYLQVNSEPILNDERNIFILLWLERKGYATENGISKTTNIPIQDINEILQLLYKNGLISIWEDGYRITGQGIDLLDTLGYSDMQIQELLSLTAFTETEYDLYKGLFVTYRKRHLGIYLFFIQTLENERKELFKESKLIVRGEVDIGKKEYLTLWIANIFHVLAHIVYTNEESNLINYYNKIYDFSKINYCFSSEIYHNEYNELWSHSKARDQINHFIIGNFKDRISEYMSKLSEKQASRLNSYLLLDINRDLKISNQILNQDSEIFNVLFSSKNILELSRKLNLSEIQTKFVLKSMQSKINELLGNAESI